VARCINVKAPGAMKAPCARDICPASPKRKLKPAAARLQTMTLS
jgi:hypothetical protein